MAIDWNVALVIGGIVVASLIGILVTVSIVGTWINSRKIVKLLKNKN